MAQDSYKRIELSQQQVGSVAAIALLGVFFVFMVGYRCGKTCCDELTSDSFGDRLYYAFASGRDPILSETVRTENPECFMSEQDARQAVEHFEQLGLKAHCKVQESSTVGGAVYHWYSVELEVGTDAEKREEAGMPRESSR